MINTPVKEQVDLEDLKNQITMAEGELKRLTELRVSEDYTVSELVKAKKWHQDEVSDLEKTAESKAVDIKNLEKEYQAALDTIAKSDSLKAELDLVRKVAEAEKSEAIASVADAREEVEKRSKEVSEAESDIDARRNELDEREAKLEAKEAKFIAFVEDLRK